MSMNSIDGNSSRIFIVAFCEIRRDFELNPLQAVSLPALQRAVRCILAASGLDKIASLD
jgi:hypothetical protein